MPLLQETIDRIKPLDERAMADAINRQQRLTKPAGSLGALEDISVRLAGITGSTAFDLKPKTVIIMAADHGVVAEGVSAYPQEVTPQMVVNFVHGGAAINVLAGHAGAKVVIVDIGVASDIDNPGVINRKIRYGTANFVKEPSMTRGEAVRAIEVGIDIAQAEIERGARMLATGDMGIGNTTTSSAMLTALTAGSVYGLVGRGTGVDDDGLALKHRVIDSAIAALKPDTDDPIDVLSKVGGLEIAGLAGVIIGAAANATPVVIDGFISGAAAFLASRIAPLSKDYMFASHLSVEPGHAVILKALGLEPVLYMNMRLGEGTGAVLAMGIIEAAAKILQEMATFEEAGVSEREAD